MPYSLLLITICALLNWVNPQANENRSTSPLSVQEGEVLDLNSMQLNGKVPFRTATKALKLKLGEPDSVVASPRDCEGYLKAEKLYYYGSTYFHIYGDTATMIKINFGDGHSSLATNKIVLNGQTSLEDLKQLFPMEVDNAGAFDIMDNDGKKLYNLTIVSLPVSLDSHWGDSWELVFKDDKLSTMEYKGDC